MSILGWSPNLPKTPMVDRQGRLTSIWQSFLESLYLRVGGASAPTNVELETTVITVMADMSLDPRPLVLAERLSLADLAPVPGSVTQALDLAPVAMAVLSEGELGPPALGVLSEEALDPRSESVTADFSLSPIGWP